MTFELPTIRTLLPAAVAMLAAALIVLLFAGAPRLELGLTSSASGEPEVSTATNAASNYGSLPLSFQPNAGRGDPRLDFVTHTSVASVYLNARGATLVPAQAPASGAQALQMQMVGADPAAPHALERLPGVVNDLRGDNPARWRTEIPTFERVRYSSLYPGVALDWYGNQRRLEYDFRLSPHADPGQIAVRMAGADRLRLAANGDLVIGAFGEQIRQHAPIAYQPAAHGAPRPPVDVAYDVKGNTVGFELGAYDKSRPLVIDPLMLTYATYLGGGLVDEGRAITVDPAGAAYIAGSTSSTNFDLVGGIEGNEADVDAFVTKLNPAGSAIVYSTYLGGNGNDQAHGIAVDSAGAAHITGHTSSIDLNVRNEFESDSNTIDAFVSKLTPAGSALAYSTYLGGDSIDEALEIAIRSGDIYVTGRTFSTDFDRVGGIEGDSGDANFDAFVAKLDPAQSGSASLVYSTYLGGDVADQANGIAVDSSGAAYVAGTTSSSDFDLVGSIEGDSPDDDAFVSKLNPAGSALVYSTYLGGSDRDEAHGIAVDSSGAAYLTGFSDSSDFDLVNSYEGNSADRDAIVAKLNPAGSALAYSTYLGGDAVDDARGIAVDPTGAAYVVGGTTSTDFDLVREVEGPSGSLDAFATRLTPAGFALFTSTYVGGSGPDQARAIALDSTGAAYVAGSTTSTDFDRVGGIEGPSGSTDAFAIKLEASPGPASPLLNDSDPDSPANDNNPEIKGSAASGSTVRLYTTATCSGSPAAIGSAAQLASPGLTVTVADNATNTFWATATDIEASSPCSATSVTYVEDSSAPSAPQVNSTIPASPANDNSPEVKGSGAEAGSTVRIYDNATCTGTPLGSGTAAAFNTGAGITISVPDDSTTALRATATDAAGNVSGCSTALTYVEDSIAPAAATISSTTPASPANDNSPEVKGSGAEAASTVHIYDNPGCTGTPLGSGTAAAFNTGAGITATVAANSTTNLRAAVKDDAGNVSPCSNAIAYVEDSNAPAAPQVDSTSPASPADDNNPEVIGSAEAGSTVRLYKGSDCTAPPLHTASASSFASPGFTISVADDSTTNLRATATDAAGNVSGCSTALTYVEDSTAPAAPTVTATDPASPANDNSPEVSGSAEAASTVRIYDNATCTGTPLAGGTAAAFTGAGITISVPDDSTTALRATATDQAGHASPCSSAISYLEDSTIPAAATISSTTPASPANDNSPEVKGSGAEAASTVHIYDNPGCTGTPLGSGTAAAFNTGAGITATVAANSTTNLRAAVKDDAGNVSPCSNAIAYVEDSNAPAAPQVDSTSPASPADDNNPEVIGSAEAGSTVRLYKGSDCTAPPLHTASASSFASPGFTISVADDSTTNLRATATDAAGNVSGCSTALTYVEDSTAPAAPTVTATDPASPANDNSPEVSGSAEAASTVRIYDNATCTGTPLAGGTAAAFTGAGITISVPDDSTTALRATATDQAGHASPCSSAISYLEDSTIPAAATISSTTPASPANDNSPEVKGSGAEAASTVHIYDNPGCTGTPLGSGTAAAFNTGAGITATVAANSTTNLRAAVKDDAGNVSPCSNAIAYVEDSNAPAAPQVDSTSPASPADDNNPEVIGSAEAGSTVRLYKGSDCTAPPLHTASASSFASPGFTISVADDSTTNLRATATDAAGNVSGCSTALTYVEDSTAPAAPTVTATDPASPANDNSPEVSGSAEAASTVRIYDNATCTGTPLAGGTAAAFTGAGITISVPDDSTTALRATATDQAGHASPCSSAISYLEDSTIPAAATISSTTPASPANDNSPEVKGSGAEAASTVHIYDNPGCTGTPLGSGTAAAFNTGAGITATVAANSTTNLRAAVKDDAGNVSPCSNAIAYVEDSNAPAAPQVDSTSPASPADDNNPEVIGSAEAGSTVRLYKGSDCTAPPLHTASASSFASPGFTISVADDSTTNLRATATDAAGNVSGCSTALTYVEDSTAPAAPTVTATDPASPANDNSPEVSGSAEAASTVRIYDNATCTGTPLAGGTAAAFTGAGITISVPDDSTTALRATATDAPGNVSACSTALAYVEDSTAPPPPPPPPDPPPPDAIPSARTLTLAASKKAVVKGKKVTLKGTIASPAAACTSGQPVEIQRAKGTTFSPFQTATSDAAGAYSLKVKVKRTFRYRARVAATPACAEAMSASAGVKVKAKKK